MPYVKLGTLSLFISDCACPETWFILYVKIFNINKLVNKTESFLFLFQLWCFVERSLHINPNGLSPGVRKLRCSFLIFRVSANTGINQELIYDNVESSLNTESGSIGMWLPSRPGKYIMCCGCFSLIKVGFVLKYTKRGL